MSEAGGDSSNPAEITSLGIGGEVSNSLPLVEAIQEMEEVLDDTEVITTANLQAILKRLMSESMETMTQQFSTQMDISLTQMQERHTSQRTNRENLSRQEDFARSIQDEFAQQDQFQGNFGRATRQPYGYNNRDTGDYDADNAGFRFRRTEDSLDLKNYGQSENSDFKFRVDVSASIMKQWQAVKLYGDDSKFPEWHRKAVAYFSAVNCSTLMLMDPWSVPKTVEEWKIVDDNSRSSEIYGLCRTQFYKMGAVDYECSSDDSLLTLNSVYLAVIDSRPGLCSTSATVLETTLDYNALRSCLLPSEVMPTKYATRLLFFNVFNHFMLNTESTRLTRLEKLTHSTAIVDGESIKTFADRISRESHVLNMMSKSVIVSEELLKAIFKSRVFDKYGKSSHYYTNLQILSSQNPQYSFETLVQNWEVIFQNDRASEGASTQTVLSAASKTSKSNTESKGKKKEKVLSAISQRSISDQKRKLAKDKKGNLICWQYAKNKECSFGSECKFSHFPEREKVLLLFSSEELDRLMVDQVVLYTHHKSSKKAQTHYKDRFKRKVKDYKNTKGNYRSSAKNTSQSPKTSYQGAISNHKRRVKDKASANIAKTVKEESSEEVDLSESPDSRSSSESSSSSDEISNMICVEETNSFEESDSKTEMLLETVTINSVEGSEDNDTDVGNDSGVMDSGATVHLSGNLKMFKVPMKTCNVRIKCANNKFMLSKQKGNIEIMVADRSILLKEALYVPGAPMLVSIGKLVSENEYEVSFKGQGCIVKDGSSKEITTINRLSANSGLYILPFTFTLNHKV